MNENKQDIDELLNLKSSEFDIFNLKGRRLIARVLKVHDTDTFTIGWKEVDSFVKTNIRLMDIDAPELHSTMNDGKEALLCRLGRNWLIDTFLDKIIIVECSKNDKYGRLLATVYPYEDPSISINQMLMDKKFVRYYGGSLTKLPWSIEELTQGISNAAEIGIIDN